MTWEVGTWVTHLGRYMTACWNGSALLAPGDRACQQLGAVIIALLGLSAWMAHRRDDAWSWIAGGLAVFVVGLLPVLVLRAHFYTHYIAVASLGAILAAYGVLRLVTPRWPRLAGSLIPSAALVVAYLAAKVWYFTHVRAP